MLTAQAQTQADLDKAKEMYNNPIKNTPQAVQNYLGNEYLHLYTSANGTTTEFAAVTQKGTITEIAFWTDQDGNKKHDPWEAIGKTATFAVYFDLSTLEKIAKSPDPVKSFKDEWGKGIKYQGLTVNAKFKVLFMRIGLMFSGLYHPTVVQTTPTQNQTPTLKEVGAECKHGGECKTGNCIGVVPGQLYKCSCDAFRYVEADTNGKCQPNM
jgi:hypothetical protein